MLTKNDLIKIYGISLSTINNYMKEGMPFHKVGSGNRLVRFELEEVKNWLLKKEK